MKIHLQDFSGHPFQAQLSRELAGRGHEVLHTYSTQYVTGHGRLRVGPDDPAGLRIEGITANRPMVKYSPAGRARFEVAYADAWRRKLIANPADVVVVCNVPLFTLARMRRHFLRTGQRWVLWHQDVFSAAIGDEAGRRLPALAADRIRQMVVSMERKVVRDADTVVAISEPFRRRYAEWGLGTDHVRVIPNWAPIDDIRPGERDNAWSRQLPASSLRLLYAGTVGRKHNPLLLLEILDRVRASGVDADLVVISEGQGAEMIAEAAGDRRDVQLMPFQPAEAFASVLASADVLIGLLEPEASQFSVPSKVASYLAAGRPVLLLAPNDNPAASDVREGGGFVGHPDTDGAHAAAEWVHWLAGDADERRAIGTRSRMFAESRYDISAIVAEFESALSGAAHRGGSPVAASVGEETSLRE